MKTKQLNRVIRYVILITFCIAVAVYRHYKPALVSDRQNLGHVEFFANSDAVFLSQNSILRFCQWRNEHLDVKYAREAKWMKQKETLYSQTGNFILITAPVDAISSSQYSILIDRIYNKQRNIPIGRIDSICFSPNGKYALIQRDYHLWRLDVTTGRLLELSRNSYFPQDTRTTCTFSPNGRFMAAVGEDMNIRIWETRTGQLLRKFPTLSQHSVTDVNVYFPFLLTFSYDSSALWTVYDRKDLRLWNISTGRIIRTIPGFAERMHKIVLSPNGQQLAAANSDGEMTIFHLPTNKQILLLSRLGLLSSVPDDTNQVGSLEFSADSKRILVARDNILGVEVWDIISQRKLVALPPCRDTKKVALWGNGHKVVTASDTGLAIWNVPN